MLSRTFSLYRSSFAGLSKQTWLLSFVMLVNRSGTMVVPFMTLYLTSRSMGYTLSDAGIVMGLFGLGSIVGAYFGGKLTDRIGFRKVQVVTLFCGGLLFFVLGHVKTFPLICLFSFILSVVNEAFRPANSSAITHYSKAENRTRSYSLNRLAINLGWALGTSVGGLIAMYDYNLLFWVDGFTNIGAAVVLFFALRGEGPPVKALQGEVLPPAASAYKDKVYIRFIIFLTLFAICFFQLFTTIPKYWRDNLLLNESFIGFVMALNGLFIVLVEMVLVYKLEGRRNNLVYISWGVFLCSAAFFAMLLPLGPKLGTYLFIFFISLGEIVCMPFMSSYWSMRSVEGNRGQYAALFTISWGIAQSLGPFACSLIADHLSFFALFIFLGVLQLIAGWGFYSLIRKEAASA
jgi:predicted MFS family arabinose efflux permease